MSANRWWSVSVVAAGLTCCGDTALAQMSLYSPRPASGVGGYASALMSNIYQEGIGINYSADSIMHNDLRRSRAVIPFVGQSVRTGGAGFDLGLASSSGSKPFANVSSPPTVSPWMNMFRDDLGGGDDLNYQTLVRPMLNQQRFNSQIERQNIELGQRVQAMSAENAYNPQGSRDMYPTGHQTVFRNYGHFYPRPSSARR
jgi:hypothetical protein